jgi:hypothetical protein
MKKDKSEANDVSGYFDRLNKSKGTNRDTEGLGTMAIGPLIVGDIDAINGEGGKEVPDLVPTKHELCQLAEYWLKQRIERDFVWFVNQTVGSGEWRWSEYISRRLDRLHLALGLDSMLKARENAFATFRKQYPKITDEDWRVFTEGSEEEQEAWREKLWAEHHEVGGARSTSGTVTITKKQHHEFRAQRELLETIIENENLDNDILIVRYDPDLVTRAGYGPDGELEEAE